MNDLEKLSNEELLNLYHETHAKAILGDIIQKALKILLNSGYGALANKYFWFNDLRMSRSITLSGQAAVRWMEKWLNIFLNHYFSTVDEDYVITIDTDSVVGDTEIIVNGNKISIKDYYESANDDFIRYDDFNEDYVKVIKNNDKSLSYKDGKLYEGNINYIMKHKVKKELFEIEIGGRKVTVTCDHSIIVERDNNIISVKPRDIKDGDKIIYRLENIKKGTNFTIKSLGVKEEYVYDIEVEDSHNFFANDILVHNSLYLNLEHLIERVKAKNPNLSDEDCINILDKFGNGVIEPQIQKGYDEFYNYTHSFENLMVMKRECLCSSGVFVAKKRYCLNVFDNEGVRYEKPKMKIKGLDFVRSTTPDSIKKDIKNVYQIILDKDEKELQDFIIEARERFKKLKVEDISLSSSISNFEKYYDEYIANRKVFPKGCPIHVKAAITYNEMIDKMKLGKMYQKIKSGDKIKYVFLQEPNICHNEAIAYLNYFPKEFNLDGLIDYNKTFERVFIGPVENVTLPIKWNWEKINTLDDLFF